MGLGTKKGGAGNGLSGHGRTRSGMSFLIGSGHNHSRGDDGSASEARPATSMPPSTEPYTLPRPTGAAGAAAATRPASAAAAGAAAGGETKQHEASHRDSDSRARSGVSADASSVTASAAAHLFAPSRPGEHRTVFSGAGIQYPETPPPLRGNQRRPSLMNHEAPPEDDGKPQMEPELMIGEIQVYFEVWHSSRTGTDYDRVRSKMFVFGGDGRETRVSSSL